MSSSKNWSHNSFEDAIEKFVPLIKLCWMKYMKVIPVNYSEWSDTVYVIVEYELNNEGIELISSWMWPEQQVTVEIDKYLRKYFREYLNTNIGVKEFRTPQHVV